jgi:hypothetical protein
MPRSCKAHSFCRSRLEFPACSWCFTLSERGQKRGHMRPVFLKGYDLAALYLRQGFVNVGLCPCHIVALVKNELGSMGLDPRFLFRCERYLHTLLYHKRRPESTAKHALIMHVNSANRPPPHIPTDVGVF